jgi:hypothetical protein
MLAASSPDFKLIEILDFVAGVAYLIDDQAKVAHRVALQTRATGGVGVGASDFGGGVPRSNAEQPQQTIEELEPQNIEGVVAHGTRTTITYPVDSRGNDQPIIATSEIWLSPELTEMVLAKFDNPPIGEGTTKLINITRAEPDSALFQPPPAYTILDEKDSFKMTLKRQ